MYSNLRVNFIIIKNETKFNEAITIKIKKDIRRYRVIN